MSKMTTDISRRGFVRGMAVATAGAAAAGMLAGCSSSTATTTTSNTGPAEGSGEAAASGDEQSFTLKLSHGLAEDHAVHIAMLAWAEAIKEASGGTITIDIYANGTLGSETDNLTQISAGALDMAKVSASIIGNFNGEWNCVSVPYVFESKEHYYKVMDGEIAQDLYMLTEDQGFIGLTWMESGARSFYTANKEIREPSDLKGLKIRVLEGIGETMMTALGGSATILGYSDIYTAMQQGVIDGAENNVTALRDHKDVTKYYCYDEHQRIPDIVVISTSVWNSMSANQQEIMRSTAADMTEAYKTAWAEFEEEVLADASNVELITDVDKPAFQEACQSIYDDLQANDAATYAYIERIQQAV